MAGYSIAYLLPRDDKRRKLYARQRNKRGFDDTETWGLDRTIAKFVLPRLKRFKQINNGHPHGTTPESWDAEIDEMIFALDCVAKDATGMDWDWERIHAGLELFGKRFRDLWW